EHHRGNTRRLKAYHLGNLLKWYGAFLIRNELKLVLVLIIGPKEDRSLDHRCLCLSSRVALPSARMTTEELLKALGRHVDWASGLSAPSSRPGIRPWKYHRSIAQVAGVRVA